MLCMDCESEIKIYYYYYIEIKLFYRVELPQPWFYHNSNIPWPKSDPNNLLTITSTLTPNLTPKLTLTLFKLDNGRMGTGTDRK